MLGNGNNMRKAGFLCHQLIKPLIFLVNEQGLKILQSPAFVIFIIGATCILYQHKSIFFFLILNELILLLKTKLMISR